ncbi:MAG: hypothetical protein NTY64_16330, partial [Deltaproteobacteria bacterium]|nr:hypothetical protein [Deltaproteobacteria bacterium]
APTPYLYKFVNRPHGSLHFAQLLSGLKDFRREYAGQIWLEVMLCRGINDDMQEIQRLREEVEKIGPDRIQLNTVVRPPAEDFAFPLDLDRLDQIARCFSPRADVLPGKCPAAAGKIMGKPDKEILALLERRPCSLEDLSQAFGISSEKLQEVLAELQKTDAVQFEAYNHTVFYRVPKKESHQLGPLR